LKIKISAYF